MTPTAPRFVLFAVSAAAVLLAGCGSSSDDGGDAADSGTTSTTTSMSTTSSAAPGEDPVCAPLKVISDMDADTTAAIGQGWSATQEFFASNTPEVLAAYDDAIDLGTDLTADLEVLRAFTEQSASVAAESGSFEEFSNKLLSQPGVAEAGPAGLRLNTFAQETCGFSTSNGG